MIPELPTPEDFKFLEDREFFEERYEEWKQQPEVYGYELTLARLVDFFAIKDGGQMVRVWSTVNSKLRKRIADLELQIRVMERTIEPHAKSCEDCRLTLKGAL